MNDDDIRPFPLFKGAARLPTKFGVPTTPLLCAVCFVAMLAMWLSLWCWLLLIPVIAIMRLITRHDDRAFGIWWMWFETKARNRNKRFWGGSSYGPTDYRSCKRWRK